MNKFIFFSIIFLLANTACNRKAKLDEASMSKPEEFQLFLSKYNDRIANPDWFFSKGVIQVDVAQFKTSVSGTVSLEKDKRVLLAVNKLGFEVGRIYASQDTVVLLDRFRKKYFMATGEELQFKDIPFNLESLQALIMGRPHYTVIGDYHFGRDSVSFQAAAPPFNLFYAFDEKFLMHRSNIEHTKENQRIESLLFDYQTLDNEKLFAHSRDISWFQNGKQEGHVVVNFKKIELNKPRNISISIPPGYEEMQL